MQGPTDYRLRHVGVCKLRCSGHCTALQAALQIRMLCPAATVTFFNYCHMTNVLVAPGPAKCCLAFVMHSMQY